jgi:hypothetical protein
MLSFSISYWDLLKFSCFADTTERGDRGEREGDVLDNFIGSDSLIFWESWWWTDRTALITDGSVPVFENCPTLMETRLMACNEEKGRKYLIKSRLLLTSLVNFPLAYLFRFVKLLTYLLLRGESNKNSQDMGCPCQLKANRWMLFQQSLSKPERWIPISGARFVHLKMISREKLNYRSGKGIHPLAPRILNFESFEVSLRQFRI